MVATLVKHFMKKANDLSVTTTLAALYACLVGSNCFTSLDLSSKKKLDCSSMINHHHWCSFFN